MNYYNLFAAAAAPVVCVGYFIKSCRMNKDDAGERDSGAPLVVLSGMLAALAILIPLGATLLPERHFAWAAWLMVGALLPAALCMFGTIFSMISLQRALKFKPNAFPYIPSWINATWFALFLLALSSVAVKSFPAIGQESTDSTKGAPQGRFVVARDLPELGASRQVVETKWGTPAQESDSQLLYRTKDGVIVFCLDPKGLTQSITEMKEKDTDAVKPFCK
jgi:hypothetical protein